MRSISHSLEAYQSNEHSSSIQIRCVVCLCSYVTSRIHWNKHQLRTQPSSQSRHAGATGFTAIAAASIQSAAKRSTWFGIVFAQCNAIRGFRTAIRFEDNVRIGVCLRKGAIALCNCIINIWGAFMRIEYMTSRKRGRLLTCRYFVVLCA